VDSVLATQRMKAFARKLREKASSSPSIPFVLRNDDALELCVGLLSPASSWKEFSERPQKPYPPTSVDQYCATITATARRLLRLNLTPGLGRALRSKAALQLMTFLTDLDFMRQLAALLFEEGINDPELIGGATVYDPSRHLRNWVRHRWRNQTQPWDIVQQVALQMGFSAAEARLIHDVQHDSVEQMWHLGWWFEVGVLEPDMQVFLSELQQQPRWFASLSELHQTRGARMGDLSFRGVGSDKS